METFLFRVLILEAPSYEDICAMQLLCYLFVLFSDPSQPKLIGEFVCWTLPSPSLAASIEGVLTASEKNLPSIWLCYCNQGCEDSGRHNWEVCGLVWMAPSSMFFVCVLGGSVLKCSGHINISSIPSGHRGCGGAMVSCCGPPLFNRSWSGLVRAPLALLLITEFNLQFQMKLSFALLHSIDLRRGSHDLCHCLQVCATILLPCPV